MTSVKIHNVSHRADADLLVRLLQGRTYMELKVVVCPIGGSFDVLVQTARLDTSKKELTDMVLGVLCHHVLGGTS